MPTSLTMVVRVEQPRSPFWAQEITPWALPAQKAARLFTLPRTVEEGPLQSRVL